MPIQLVSLYHLLLRVSTWNNRLAQILTECSPVCRE